MRRYWMFTLLGLGLSTPAGAAEYLTSVASEVYQAPGSPREIATRAMTCISQHLSPGTVDTQLIVHSDLDGGTIVARNAVEYSATLTRWRVRSVFTFQSREGRFRIEQTNLERFNRVWGPIGKWGGSGWRGAEAALRASADAVAQCVLSAPIRDDW